MSPKKDTQKSAKSTTAIKKKSNGFTDEERAAIKERAQELKADARRVGLCELKRTNDVVRREHALGVWPNLPAASCQSGYSSFRQVRGSAGWAFGVRSSREL